MRCRLVPSTCVYRAIERSEALGTSEQGKVTWEIGRIMAFLSHGYQGLAVSRKQQQRARHRVEDVANLTMVGLDLAFTA